MNYRQRGALSLLWCAVIAAIVAAVAMVVLFSMGSGRNLLAEGTAYLQHSAAGQAADRAQAAAAALQGQNNKGGDGAVRKCTINGQVVYSNVDCRKDDPTSKVVEMHDTKGIEAPKAPPKSTEAAASADSLQQKAIDKAVDN